MTAETATGTDQPQPAGRVAYTLAEVGAMFGKSRRWARERFNDGEIPGHLLGRDVMVPAEVVDEFRRAPRQETT